MWGPLYLFALALATLFTWSYLVREEAIVFSAASASLFWIYCSLVTELVLVDGEEIAISIGPIRYLWGALAIMSMIALIGAILGIYPEETNQYTVES